MKGTFAEAIFLSAPFSADGMFHSGTRGGVSLLDTPLPASTTQLPVYRNLPHTHSQTHTHSQIHIHTLTCSLTLTRALTHRLSLSHTHMHTHGRTHAPLTDALFLLSSPAYVSVRAGPRWYEVMPCECRLPAQTPLPQGAGARPGCAVPPHFQTAMPTRGQRSDLLTDRHVEQCETLRRELRLQNITVKASYVTSSVRIYC